MILLYATAVSERCKIPQVPGLPRFCISFWKWDTVETLVSLWYMVYFHIYTTWVYGREVQSITFQEDRISPIAAASNSKQAGHILLWPPLASLPHLTACNHFFLGHISGTYYCQTETEGDVNDIVRSHGGGECTVSTAITAYGCMVLLAKDLGKCNLDTSVNGR